MVVVMVFGWSLRTQTTPVVADQMLNGEYFQLQANNEPFSGTVN